MQHITFVTSNDNKLHEAETILGMKLTRESLELDELQSMDLADIIGHKTRQAYARLGRPVIVEDAALYVEGWGGFPGPFVKWLAATMGYDVFPQSVPKDNRRAKWIVDYAYYDGQELHVFEGEVRGTIATEKRGENGWGFDPVFIPEGETETFAEMGERKYQHSARQRALIKLRDFLLKQAP